MQAPLQASKNLEAPYDNILEARQWVTPLQRAMGGCITHTGRAATQPVNPTSASTTPPTSKPQARALKRCNSHDSAVLRLKEFVVNLFHTQHTVALDGPRRQNKCGVLTQSWCVQAPASLFPTNTRTVAQLMHTRSNTRADVMHATLLLAAHHALRLAVSGTTPMGCHNTSSVHGRAVRRGSSQHPGHTALTDTERERTTRTVLRVRS